MMGQPDTSTAAPDLDRLVIRAYAGEDDLPEIVRVANSDMALDGLRVVFTLGDVAPTYANPSDSFDASRDVLVAEVGGAVVGTIRVDWVDTTDGTREYRSRGHVDARWRRHGIGRRLHHAADRLIRERASGHDTDRPRVQGMWVDDRQVGRRALAESEGYAPARWFFEMERARIDVDPPDILPMPAGLEVRMVTADDAPAIWSADHDAFQDHWGGWDASQAALRRWVESPEFQPDLFVVAFDGDEIAGAVLNGINAEENEKLGLRRGWLDSVFTRRAWRGRGLARACIGRSIHLLADRGMDTAALGVDADNPSGALGLYRSCGFEIVDRGGAWQKPLEMTR
jgi:mycothiol synthase